MVFGDIEQMMRLQQQLCNAGELSDYLVIPKSKLESNIGSSREQIFIAYDEEPLGFCVLRIITFGHDPYDSIYGEILRIVGISRKGVYKKLFSVIESDLKKQNVLSCSIKVVNDGSPSEVLCEETAQSRGYKKIHEEASKKLSKMNYHIQLVERVGRKETPIESFYSNEEELQEKIKVYMELRDKRNDEILKQDLKGNKDRPLYLVTSSRIGNSKKIMTYKKELMEGNPKLN